MFKNVTNCEFVYLLYCVGDPGASCHTSLEWILKSVSVYRHKLWSLDYRNTHFWTFTNIYAFNLNNIQSEIYCRLWQLAPVSMYSYTNVILCIHTHTYIPSKIYEWHFSFLSVCLWIELMCVQFWASLEVVSDSSGLSGRVCVWIQIRQRLQAY